MSSDRHGVGPEIGPALKQARRRLGMEMSEAEERTKIRTRYLRALENEDWEILPAPAYIKGFLRTYGQLLGLDGAMLADTYRRQIEESPTAGPLETALRERRRVAEPRRRPGERPPSRGPLIGAVAIGIVVLLLILGLVGGGDSGTTPDKRAGAAKGGRARHKEQGSSKPDKPVALSPVDLRLEVLSDAQICLVAGTRAVIDDQLLNAGAAESYSGEKSYRLDLSGGKVLLQAGNQSQKIEATDPVSYEADSQGIREIGPTGPNCP